MCTKCRGKGKLYQIDGSLISIKSCNCETAKEQQLTYIERTDKLKKEIDNIIATLMQG